MRLIAFLALLAVPVTLALVRRNDLAQAAAEPALATDTGGRR